MVMPEFRAFPKIYRLRRQIIVTEKIDGTNACVHVPADPAEPILAGSRSRWISPEQDNFGFAKWVQAHAEELRELGPGTHFGEWWGRGIQRGYGLSEKRFSLFNVSRWGRGLLSDAEPPRCCDVVPHLGIYDSLDTPAAAWAIERLRTYGSVAAPGYMCPEGVVIFHVPSGQMFKQTIEKDDVPKAES
jgi:RNA ligase